jgi:hypothetical protein
VVEGKVTGLVLVATADDIRNSRNHTRKAVSMRLRSPLYLAVAFGLVGFLVGGFGGLYGSMWVASGRPPRLDAGVLGQYAAPYGLVGGLLGLAAGAWAGLRLGRRREPR